MMAFQVRRVGFVSLLILYCLAISGCGESRPADGPPGLDGPGNMDWPLTLQANEGQLEIYQPQPQSLAGNQLKARAAVSLLTPKGKMTFGVAWFTARLETDRDLRLTDLSDFNVTAVRVRGTDAAEQGEFSRIITDGLNSLGVSFPMDQFAASLDTAERVKVEASQIQNTPPIILFRTTPSTLITLHGSPRMRPMTTDATVQRVVNTPFILLLDTSDKHYYLKTGTEWMTAVDLKAAWQAAPAPPAIARAGQQLAAPSGAASASSTRPAFGADLANAGPTQIIIATQPTELIATQGSPQFAPLQDGQLYYVKNTQSNVFLDSASGQDFVLLSGRWFVAPDLAGPWKYIASNQLPAAFASISPDSPKGNVLPFVAITAQAREAVLDASVPQTAAILRDAGAQLQVAYDGQPRFAAIQGTPVTYAVNTPQSVLQLNGMYYCCDQAVWYQASSSQGPWSVCVAVPPAIYQIPPSCPLYNTRFVRVYDSNPDTVYTGYLPGYMGSYVDGPTVVYGTGYDYPDWDGDAYFAAPCTWGFAAFYDPFDCDWGFGLGFGWNSNWLGYLGGEGWWHDHWHGRDGGGHWWGPGGFHHGRDNRGLANGGRGVDGTNRDGHNGASAGRIGARNLYQRQANRARNASAAHAQQIAQARTAAHGRNNLFAGSDGGVYRRDNAGWQERQGDNWARMDRVPESRADDLAIRNSMAQRSFAQPDDGLNRDYAARSRGFDRASSYQRSSGGFGGGGFRAGGFSGGGFHGGGGGHGGGRR